MATQSVWANNIRIVGNVKIDPTRISGNTAIIELQVEWDNSWRNAWNHDAAYVFLKYKLTGKERKWNHLYLMDAGHTLSEGYGSTLVKSTTTANRNEGIFIYRSNENYTAGKSSVRLELKWLFTSGAEPLTRANFDKGEVEVSAMTLEMVYIPRGAFRAGDGFSKQSFEQHYFPIPDVYNIATEQYAVQASSGSAVLAVNKVNDIYNAANSNVSTSNAWGGNTPPAWWMIDFGKYKEGQETGEQKVIRYFGIEGHPSYVPQVWRLEGSNDAANADWDTLYDSRTDAKSGDWVTEMLRVYPVTRAVKVPRPGKYRYYRVYIESTVSNAVPLIKSIAMTEADLDTLRDRSVLVWNTFSVLNTGIPSGGVYGASLSAPDGFSWSGNTSSNYPNGYPGFYAMKYEITQEQYVAFLNKLTHRQQLQRTIGPLLENYNKGEFVFGDLRTAPACRNGIVLADQPKNENYPFVFANDLNGDGQYNQDGDGQTLACNFLCAGDLLAYADWCGLRPLTELEFEKMGRRLYPIVPKRGEYPWNTLKANFTTGLKSGEGTIAETADGNVNAGGKIPGPARVGAFAGGAASQEAAGASWWGVMELGGNLAEVYYNVDPEGRNFGGIAAAHHGDGLLTANGTSDVSAWPAVPGAFAFRGGHFASSSDELRTSDRTRANRNYAGQSSIDLRDSSITFRVGYTAPYRSVSSPLQLENGRTDSDTVYSGSSYFIRGDRPTGMKDSVTYMWFCSENRGATWDVIEGAHDKSLQLENLLNNGTIDRALTEYRYFRKCFCSDMESVSPVVYIRVLNPACFYLARTVDTLDHYGRFKGTSFYAYNYFAPFSWKWKGKTLASYGTDRTRNTALQHFVPQVWDLKKDGVLSSGSQYIDVVGVKGSKINQQLTFELYVKPEPPKQNSDVVTCGNDMIDARDNKVYPTIKIGDQCWMAKNLDYRGGGYKCYSDLAGNCDIYGALYNWNQAVGVISYMPVKGICPEGWHVPIDREWRQMWNSAGASYTYIRSGSVLWGTSGVSVSTNRSGFSALPGGGYFWTQSNNQTTYAGIHTRTGFYDIRERGWWWTATSRVHYWTTVSYGDSYNIMNMPYYVRMDYNTNMYFNTPVNWGSYPYQYMGQSIFCSSTYAHLTTSYNSSGLNSGHNNTAEVNTKANFYFSVRCVKDIELESGKVKMFSGSYYAWKDGTYARSALEYINNNGGAPLPDGVYRIDPDGPGGNAAFDVWCDMTTDGGGWMLAGKFSNHDARTWCVAASYWTNTSTFGEGRDPETFADAKTKAWTLAPVNYMMFKTMRVEDKAFVTTTSIGNKTLSNYFTSALSGFSPTRSGCYQILNIKFINSGPGDFAWIAGPSGFNTNHTITIAKGDGGDESGIISGETCGGGAADYGLGISEGPAWGNSSYNSDVGTNGGVGLATSNNVLLFVR